MSEDLCSDDGRCPGAEGFANRPGCTIAGTEPHLCPFREEIHGDHETKCNCCKACEEECAGDI